MIVGLQEALETNSVVEQIITVGVGSADKEELQDIATPPYSQSVHHVSNYDAIKDIQNVLAAKLCESEGDFLKFYC